MEGYLFHPQQGECGYFPHRASVTEGAVLRNFDKTSLEFLISRGVRHFGDDFFRPQCLDCGLCVPIRIDVKNFIPSRGQRRILSRGRRFSYSLSQPHITEEAWRVYRDHCIRFNTGGEEDFESFRRSFFTPHQGHYVLTARDGDDLVFNAHLDLMNNSISAVYCYYHHDYNRFSPGSLAILKELEIAGEMGLEWLYLGYWISGHRHMDYKVRFFPNQLLLSDDSWYNYLDSDGKKNGEIQTPVYHPGTALKDLLGPAE